MPRIAKVISQCMIDGKRIDPGAVVALPNQESYDRLTKAGCLVPASRQEVYQQEEKDNDANNEKTPKADVKKSEAKSEKKAPEIAESEKEKDSEVEPTEETKDSFLEKNILPKKKKTRKKKKRVTIDD